MLTRVFHVAGLLASLAETKIELGLTALKRGGVATLLRVAAAFVAIVAVFGLHGALYILLAPTLGPAGALAAVSLLALALAAGVVLIAHRSVRKGVLNSRQAELQAQLDHETQQLRIACGIAQPNDDPSSPHSDDTPGTSPTAFLTDSKVWIAAAVAMVGVLGPVRMLRAMRFASALVATGALVKRAAETHHQRE